MSHLSGFDGVLERIGNMLLANHVIKNGRTILSGGYDEIRHCKSNLSKFKSANPEFRPVLIKF